MGSFIIKLVLNAVALIVGDRLLDDVKINSFKKALIIALVLAVLNATLGAILHTLATPFTWLTLGFFTFIVNAAIILIAARLMDSFTVRNFWAALCLAVIIAVVNWFTYSFFGVVQ